MAFVRIILGDLRPITEASQEEWRPDPSKNRWRTRPFSFGKQGSISSPSVRPPLVTPFSNDLIASDVNGMTWSACSALADLILACYRSHPRTHVRLVDRFHRSGDLPLPCPGPQRQQEESASQANWQGCLVG